MISAYEANKATKDRLDQVAKEFIINTVSTMVREAIDRGVFTTTIELFDPLDQQAADRLVTLLRDEYRFKVEFTPANLGAPALLDLSWEVEEE